MFSGSVKIGASLSFLVLIVAYLYKRHADEILQERLRDVLSGLLRAEKKISLESKRVAVGFGACEDIFTNGLNLLHHLNLTSPQEAVHQDLVNTPEELAQLFAFFFESGAAAERYVANASLFEEIVKAGMKGEGYQWAIGGNAAVIARRLAMEGFDVLLGARMGQNALDTISDSVKVIGNSIPRSDIHLIMEYKTNDQWGKFTSPRANRLVLHNDKVNPFLDGMEEFLDKVLTFKPSLLVIGGLQMMDNFPDDKGVRFERLEKLSQFLQKLPRSTLIHFEMASFTEFSLLTEIIHKVIYYCDSLGANEQELPNILQVVQGKNVTLVSDQRPRVATVLDQIRKLYAALGDTSQMNGRRPLTRIHIHTLAFQAILTHPDSAWKNSMSATAKAALTAHRHTCGDHDIDAAKARLIMDGSFALSSQEPKEDINDSSTKNRIYVNNQRPVSCWEESGLLPAHVCVAPVLVCTQILKTAGGGDNISGAGLVLQI
ncbi:ADP-dependent glucokinase-like [Plakobranchus ocellatus]|uniref:ADP-dependent glucokinase-like n=1 Tax=Plakobranchus ocellatus TaxID=259542 RepID=A0AAV4B563_9GAST|nr:ADP-dependent glucokinase-like [Plakobranchus ocellatus]